MCVCVARGKQHLSVDLRASGKLHSAAAVIPQIKGDSLAGWKEDGGGGGEEDMLVGEGAEMLTRREKLQKLTVLISAGF